VKDEPDHVQAPGATGNSILSNTCPAGGISTADLHHNSWCLILPVQLCQKFLKNIRFHVPGLSQVAMEIIHENTMEHTTFNPHS